MDIASSEAYQVLESMRTNLSVTKSDSPDPVIAGNILTYTMVVTITDSTTYHENIA